MSRLPLLFVFLLLTGCGTSSSSDVAGPSTVRCAVSVTPSANPVAPAGGATQLAIGINRECAWTASSEAEWITITSGTSGQGQATLDLSVAPNPLSQTRTGSIVVNDQRFQVSQAGAPCTYRLSLGDLTVGSSGGTRTVTISAPGACAWTARSDDAWITITSGSSGTGTGTVRLSIAPLESGARTGTVTIAGQTVTVQQDSQIAGDPGAPLPDPGCNFAVSPSTGTVPADGGSGTLSVSAADGCQWSAASDAPWLSVSGNGSGSGSVTYQAQANQTGSPRAASISIGDQVVLVTQAAHLPAVCTFSVSPETISAPAGGLAGSVSLQASDESCSWSATSSASWLVISGTSTGAGSGELNFTALVNQDGAPRSATISVGGRTVTVNQSAQSTACSFTLSSSATTMPSGGGTGQVGVTASDASCAWTATSNAPWITVTAGSPGTGNGQVSFTVAANPTQAERVGTVTVGGQTLTVTQAADAGSSCSVTVSTTVASIGSGGGSGQVDVTATDASCAWTATSNVTWISVTSGATGTGNGQVAYTVEPNSTQTERVGTLTIAGQTVTVTQAAAPGPSCSFTLSTTAASIGSGGGSGQVGVTATDASCAWTATSNVTWISVTAGSSGTGSGQVSYTVEPNTAQTERVGTLTIAGQTFTVTQAAAPTPCSFTVAPTSASVPSDGGSGQVSVTASDASCAWSASSGAVWIVISGGGSGSGSGTVSYTVDPNPTTSERTGTLTVAGQSVVITQAGDDGYREIEGTVSNLSGSCPDLRFVVAGQAVETNAATIFSSGCGGLRDGRTVIVRGFLQTDGSLLASEVER